MTRENVDDQATKLLVKRGGVSFRCRVKAGPD